MRCVAFEAKRTGLVAGSIALSPGLVLRDQIVKADKIADMARRYEIDQRQAMRVRTMRDPFEQPFPNDEYLISSTFELATRRIDIFSKMADSISYTTGRPVLFFIDECHEASEQKRRGDFVAEMVNKGAMFVLVTATPIRADKEIIPGFRSRVLDERDARRFVSTDAGDGVNNKIDVYEGRKELVVLDADHITTFKQAWNEIPTPLCHLSREVIDVDLATIDDESTTTKKLSESSPTEARRYLGKAVKNTEVMARAVDLLVDHLMNAKRVNPRCAAIVFTGNDEATDNENNAHAKRVKALITESQRRYKANMDARIVTMKTDNQDDEKSAKAIQDFVGTDEDNGRGDILIVKQMAGRGLDAPRVKVILDLSSVRTVASVVQRIMRCATPYHGWQVGTVITMADPMMSAIWKQQISDEGGDDVGDWRERDMEWKREYLKEKQERDDQHFFIDGADLGVYDDSHGYIGDMGLRGDVDKICMAFPEITARLTRPEIQRRWCGVNAGELDPVEPVVTVDAEVQRLRREIVEQAKANAGPYPGKGNPVAVDEWRNRLTNEYTQAKRVAGVDESVNLEYITSVRELKLMLNALVDRSQQELPL
jgi:hypothetical protein